MKTLWYDAGPAGLAVADRRTPVLALHGSASTGSLWQGLSDYLRGRYRVTAPDLPDVAGAGSAAEARTIEVLELGNEPVHIVGHAHGAAIALEIALSRPELVRSLTLIEPTVFHLLCEGDRSDLRLLAELFALSDRMDSLMEAGDVTAGMRHYTDFWHGGGAWQRTSLGLRSDLAQRARRTASDLSADLAEAWPMMRLAEIDCPTLVAMALESPVASLRVAEMTAEAIPGARLAMIADAGHMSPLTDPHIVDPLIGGHLKSADSVRSGAMRPSHHRYAFWA